MSLIELSAWLEANQLFTFSMLIPGVSALVAMISSRFAVRRALDSERAQRQFSATTQIAGFRQEWINSLRSEIAEHQALCFASMPPLNQDSCLSKDRTYRLAELSNRILLRVNRSDPEYDTLSKALAIDRLRISQNEVPAQDTTQIAQSILKREWERLKSDLKSDALEW